MRWRFWGESSSTPVPVDDFLNAATFDVERSAYVDILKGIGRDGLDSMGWTKLIEVTTEGLEPYVDYDLGDTVQVRLSASTVVTGTVTEIVESWDSRGYKATPTLAWDP